MLRQKHYKKTEKGGDKMKKTIKYALTMAVICLVLCAGVAMIPAEAADEGATIENAINLKEGVYQSKWWNHYSKFRPDCYNKIVIPKKGCMTFTVIKPINEDGEIESFDFVLYNSNGEVVWAADSYEQIKSSESAFIYYIGLNAGTYYMNLDPSFFVDEDSDGMETRYKYDFEACNDWETENNNTTAKSNAIELGKFYSGVYGEESFDYTYADCYSVRLTAGEKYEITLDNYMYMQDLAFGLYDAEGNAVDLTNERIEIKTTKWDATVNESGTYYLRLEGCGNGVGINYLIGVSVQAKDSLSGKVSGIKATQTTTSIKLSWNKLDQATGYRVYQYSPSKGKYVKIASVKTNSFNKTGLKAGTTYKFKVKAYKKLSDGTVIWADSSAVFTTATKCSAPKLTLVKNYKDSPKVKLQWDTVKGATGYQAYYATSKNGEYKKITLKSAGSDSVIKEFSSSASGKTIYFKVRAYTKVDGKTIYSGWSSVKSAVLN